MCVDSKPELSRMILGGTQSPSIAIQTPPQMTESKAVMKSMKTVTVTC